VREEHVKDFNGYGFSGTTTLDRSSTYAVKPEKNALTSPKYRIIVEIMAVDEAYTTCGDDERGLCAFFMRHGRQED
jgi:hypothetical protein